jgi:AcrR family transcriptional regulator
MAVKRIRRAHGRPQGGSEQIVAAILAAALEQLEANGFAELRVEEVARAAGVNKTSVYRRWPSKGDLVIAALGTLRDDEPSFVESGDLRRDLIDMLTAKAATFGTSRGRRIMRALMAFDDDEVAGLTSALREHRYTKPRALLARAIERGALPAGSDPSFLCELLLAPVLHRILILNEPVDAEFLAKVVDHVLAGTGPGASDSVSRPRARAKQL